MPATSAVGVVVVNMHLSATGPRAGSTPVSTAASDRGPMVNGGLVSVATVPALVRI